MAKHTQNSTAHKGGATQTNQPTGDQAAHSTAPADTEVQARIQAGRETRKAEISAAKDSVVAKKDAKPEVEKFQPNQDLLKELRGLTDAELVERAKDKMRPVDVTNNTIYGPPSDGNRQDHLNGQDIGRSAIRSAVREFVESRSEQQAPANAIIAYMILGAGQCYKGKFDAGYLTTKDGENGKRGMVARRLLRIVQAATPAAAAEKKEQDKDEKAA